MLVRHARRNTMKIREALSAVKGYYPWNASYFLTKKLDLLLTSQCVCRNGGGLVQLVEPLTPERVQFPGTDKYRPGSLSMSPRHEKFYKFIKRILITTNDESQKPSIKKKKIKQHLAFEKPGQKRNLCNGSDFVKLYFLWKLVSACIFKNAILTPQSHCAQFHVQPQINPCPSRATSHWSTTPLGRCQTQRMSMFPYKAPQSTLASGNHSRRPRF